VGNDQISSLIVAPGMQATLCKENGRRSARATRWPSFHGFTFAVMQVGLDKKRTLLWSSKSIMVDTLVADRRGAQVAVSTFESQQELLLLDLAPTISP